jgi:hypothetical protein
MSLNDIILLILEFFRIKIFYSRSFPQTGENPLHSPWPSWAQFRKRKPTGHSVHSNVCSMINCNSDKCFGLVDIGRWRLEEDSTGDGEWRVLSPAFVTNHSTSFRVLSIVA